LSGWDEGASARVPRPGTTAVTGGPAPAAGGLTGLLGPELVAAVAALAGYAWRLLGDDVIEWAADDRGIWLLQSQRSGTAAREAAAGPSAAVDRAAPASQAMTAGRGAATGPAGPPPGPGHAAWAGRGPAPPRAG